MSETSGSELRDSRVAVVTWLPTAQIDELYTLFQAAFTPMMTRAAARHMFTRDEFAQEVGDERVVKFVVQGDDGALLGFTALAGDVHAVPWIDAEFYLTRYAEAATRDALFYLMFTLVVPGAATHGVFRDMMYAVCDRAAATRAVVGMDYSSHNARGAVGRIVQLLPRLYGVRVEEVDTQTYYALQFPPSTTGAGTSAGTQSAPVEPTILDRQHFYIADFRDATGGTRARQVPRPRPASE